MQVTSPIRLGLAVMVVGVACRNGVAPSSSDRRAGERGSAAALDAMRAADASAPDAPALDPTPARVLREDLDGDGEAEAIRVTPSAIEIAATTVEHSAGLRAAHREVFGVTVLDLDRSDRARELLVEVGFTDFDGRDHRMHFVYSFGKRGIAQSSLPAKPGPASGNGTLVVRHRDCGRTITIGYQWRDGALHIASEQTRGRFEPGPGCED